MKILAIQEGDRAKSVIGPSTVEEICILRRFVAATDFLCCEVG